MQTIRREVRDAESLLNLIINLDARAGTYWQTGVAVDEGEAFHGEGLVEGSFLDAVVEEVRAGSAARKWRLAALMMPVLQEWLTTSRKMIELSIRSAWLRQVVSPVDAGATPDAA